MDNKLPVPKPDRTKTPTGEIVKVLILAVVSFVAGFAMIYFFLRPSAPEVAPEELPTDDISQTVAQSDTPDTPASATAVPPKAKSAGAVVPPGETPEGIAQTGEPHYLKCWDKTGIESDGDQCDRLLKLENRFTERLYVVDECKNRAAGQDTTGKLVVACEVNFDTGNVSFWNGASSDVRNASDIGDCLRNELAGLPIESIEHEFSRYRVYFSVEFGRPGVISAVATASGAAAEQGSGRSDSEGPSAPPPGAGKMVRVIKDRVRVRKAPETGEPIGKISTGNQVRLLKQENGWCHIVTPNNNEGWMICTALAL
ncbi:MAG: SH3 domain-containing protein [Deltaproteobacteria bacterium]|nr:SH3 domain-containing protein [Deltaproteobacteria bacterium]